MTYDGLPDQDEFCLIFPIGDFSTHAANLGKSDMLRVVAAIHDIEVIELHIRDPHPLDTKGQI